MKLQVSRQVFEKMLKYQIKSVQWKPHLFHAHGQTWRS